MCIRTRRVIITQTYKRDKNESEISGGRNREMVQQFRVLATLTEDTGSTVSTHMMGHNCL